MIEMKFVRTPVRQGAVPSMPSPKRRLAPFFRRCLLVTICTVCVVLLLQKFFLEPFRVTSSSMAPSLLGPHRRCICPSCGIGLTFARQPTDNDGTGGADHFSKAWCFNCGQGASIAGSAHESAGDQILVDKTAFTRGEPQRWDLAVFRWLGQLMIKRILGLSGEEIEIREGDVYTDGVLTRKPFEQSLAMRVLLWDMQYSPAGTAWNDRFEADGEPVDCSSAGLEIDGRKKNRRIQNAHQIERRKKLSPILDEYGYNGSSHAQAETVHDFHLETDLEIGGGHGSITLGLCDGHDWAEVTFFVAKVGAPKAFWGNADGQTKDQAIEVVHQEPMVFVPKGRYHLQLAFVDRRFHVRVDGQPVVVDGDLPSVQGKRQGVPHPFRVTAEGVLAVLKNVRLFRDVHYSQRGEQGVSGRPVRLGMDQYFVLGDNSPISEDSRFWPDGGRVSRTDFVGRPVLVHLPSVAWTSQEGTTRWQMPALDRIRWLR